MSFRSRMTMETGAPMPRFLYLLDKVGHTAILALLFWRLFPITLFASACIATIAYVSLGLFAWYRGGIKRWTGPGSFTGDLFYHSMPSLVVPALAYPQQRILSLLGVVVCAVVWWQLDTANYGQLRASPDSPPIPTP